METKPTKTERKEKLHTWRNWGDHPLVVAILVATALVGTLILFVQFLGERKALSGTGQYEESTSTTVPQVPSATTFQDFMNYIYRESHTSAQEDEFIARHLGRKVSWDGWVGDVSDYGGEGLSVVLKAGEHEANLLAFARFPPGYRTDLLALTHGQRIKVSCVLESFSAQAKLEGCRLLHVWPRRQSKPTTSSFRLSRKVPFPENLDSMQPGMSLAEATALFPDGEMTPNWYSVELDNGPFSHVAFFVFGFGENPTVDVLNFRFRDDAAKRAALTTVLREFGHFPHQSEMLGQQFVWPNLNGYRLTVGDSYQIRLAIEEGARPP